MNLELVNTGSELMLGRVLNTHQQWLCRQLADAGYVVRRQVAVADTAPEIREAVRDALRAADVVICTGGLGPTSDDLTRDVIAALLGRTLREDPGVTAELKAWYATRKRVPPPAVFVQAQVPEGAEVLPNAHGTAPGLLMQTGAQAAEGLPPGRWLVMLPGPPRELRPMFTNRVLPWLRRTFPQVSRFVCRTLRSTGVPESTMQGRIAGPLAGLVDQGLEVGYCARPGEVDVRLVAQGPEAETMVEQALAVVRREVGSHIYGEEAESLESAVVGLLKLAGSTLAVVESCTGGRIASRITDVPGASAVFLGGFVTYADALKQSLVGVRSETLETHGAVSEPVAREMAEGARDRTRATYALAVTGIAGPAGGTSEKPVGTAYLALAHPDGTEARRVLNAFDRETFKHMTSQQALEMLRQRLLPIDA